MNLSLVYKRLLATPAKLRLALFSIEWKKYVLLLPLQYQKWLRLNEARRLMLAEDQDAATAAFQVGYESPSQFSREYNRLFGNSPLRDITNLRQTTAHELA